MGNPALTRDHAEARRAPTVEQATRRLLAALDRLAEGNDAPGFSGWENGNGEPVGDEVEAARHELRALLTLPPAMPVMSDTFEKVWRAENVQAAGRDFGHRGVAEVIWREAMKITGNDDNS